ncbi:TetR/AcrR family transcriptional regulator [Kiloniella laminariae]|uniref:TetR/AcrR family transcriptional regulator n=1 Tax=Kiloniella laminariae TaxID=454162 RepID=A0ABT4LDJ5_9PROT|nr:TetR/AcrR family transcriptional regulator [Kiloniella laminariae]MCZ4279168.1 TetR/AcrR family transcriptional regulator [Kiloniella laminariae]
MARPREFDIEVAVEAALQVFWARGYDGAGLGELLEVMQIARSSLYKTFGDKRSLFLAALAHYDITRVSAAVSLLRDGLVPDGGQRIANLLMSVAEVIEAQGDRRGCFLCNTAVDQAPHDAEISAQVRRMMGRMEAGFFSALEATDLGRTRSRDGKGEARMLKIARSLNTIYNGVRVMAKAGYPAAEIRTEVQAQLQHNGLANTGAVSS